MNWQPFSISEIQTLLPDSQTWFLDGGEALDVFLGRQTRLHGDIDIGVLSQDVEHVLSIFIGNGFDVRVANRGLSTYDPNVFDANDYNYWVSDKRFHKLQILVYQVHLDRVSFRRNTDVTWPLTCLTLQHQGYRIINPLVSYAFKITTNQPQQKDLQDIAELSHWFSKND